MIGSVLLIAILGAGFPVATAQSAADRAASEQPVDTVILAEHLEPFRPLLGLWEGHSEAQGRTMRSLWEWAPTAGGAALLLTVAEGFGDQSPVHTMTEFLARSNSDERLTMSTANGRGGFTLQGTMASHGDGWVRSWDMVTVDGRAIQGRDSMTLESADRIRWTQHLDSGDGWVEVGYSPFYLTRTSPGDPARPDWAKALDSSNRVRFANDVPGCVVGVVEEGELRYERGFGRASLEWDVPLSPRTRLRIGSLAKQFTGFAVSRLIEEQRVDADASIRTYLPQLSEIHDQVRVSDLIHHTSGVRDYGTFMFLWSPPFADRSTEDRVFRTIARQEALNFAPGTEQVYSNSGYLLLARLVEAVVGRPFEEVLSDWVFEPLGMDDTVVHGSFDMVIPGFAPGYVPQDDGFKRQVPTSMVRGAAGVVTSLADLARWESALRDPPEGWSALVARMHRAGVFRDGTVHGYGYGIWVRPFRGLPAVDHGGSFGGYRAGVLRLPEQDLSMVLLCNRGDVQPRAELTRVAEIVMGDRLPAPPAPPRASQGGDEGPPNELPLPPSLVRSLSGTYVSTQADALVRITRDSDGSAVLELSGDRRLPMTLGPEDPRGERPIHAATGFMPLVLRLEGDRAITGFELDFFRDRGIRFTRVPGETSSIPLGDRPHR